MRYLMYSYYLDSYTWVEDIDLNYLFDYVSECMYSETGFSELQARAELAREQRDHPDRWENSPMARMVFQADRLDREGADCL